MKKKKFGFLLLAFTCLCIFTSCNQEKVYVESEYVKSTMTLKYKGIEYSTDDNVFYYDFNIDEDDAPENMVFTARHYKRENGEIYGTNDRFIFTCEYASLGNVTDTSCTIDAKNLNGVGFYLVYAQSTVDSSFDTYFIVNVTANEVVLAIDYWINGDYVNENLDYTDEMLGGTITSVTKELVLCAGAVYDYKIYDTSEQAHAIKGVVLNSTNSCIYFRQNSGASGSFVCMPEDTKSSTLSFVVGKEDYSVFVKCNLVDISTAEVRLIDGNLTTQEFVLSFVANPPDDRGRTYLYQIDLETVLMNEEAELYYCLDFENWDDEAENKFINNEKFKVSENENPQWYTKTTLLKITDGSTKFICDVDGTLRQFKITPLDDTTFIADDHTDRNRHCYLYAKYKNDPINQYRWKWRIMVGGVLESLQMNVVEDSEESIIEKDIEVKEGDQTGWIFRAKYIPQTTANINTIWYLSDNKTEYVYKNGSVSFSAPRPVAIDPSVTKGNIKNQVINMMSGVDASRTGGYNPFGTVEYTDINGEVFKLGYYWLNEAVNGLSDLWTNFNSLGEDVIVVAMNTDTFLYTSVGIKDLGDKQITIRGITSASQDVPASYTSGVTGRAIRTNYESSTAEQRIEMLGSLKMQGYPYTVISPYEIYRTFYMPVDSQLSLTLESTFKMNNVSILPEASAKQVFASYEADLSDSGTSAILTLPTKYKVAPEEERRRPNFKESCLTDEAIVKVSVNGQYDFKLRIVVY